MKKTSVHPYHLHGIRVLLFGILLVALFLVRIDSPSLSATSDRNKVLAYSTNVSRTDLLNNTNTYRAQNGLAPLTLNTKLNSSSQAKAQHMVDNNYWAHVAPDGTQPWYFFDQAGYTYSSAGENLAYGFDTSAAIITAWMNSTTHRANVLGNYVDVGFGYVNSANYQGGEYTVVVAHYGTPSASAAVPAPTAATSASAPQATTPITPSKPVASVLKTTAPAPVASVPAPIPTPAPVISNPKPDPSPATTTIPVATGTAKSVSVFESLKLPNPPLTAIVSIALTVATAAGYALTHRSLVRHAVAGGEKFVVMHPAIDTAAVATISILILTTTISHIR